MRPGSVVPSRILPALLIVFVLLLSCATNVQVRTMAAATPSTIPLNDKLSNDIAYPINGNDLIRIIQGLQQRTDANSDHLAVNEACILNLEIKCR